MPTTDNPKQVLRRYLKAMTHGKPGDLTKLVTPNIVGIQGEERLTGAPAVEAYAAHYRQTYPNWRFELEEAVAEGNRVAARGCSVGTIPASGKFQAEEKRIPWMAFYKLSRGRIAEVRMMADPSALMSQGRALRFPLEP